MKTKLFILSASLLLASACSIDTPTVDNGVAAVFITNLAQRVPTRMVDNQWAEKDAIGIFSITNEMEGVTIDGQAAPINAAVNLQYTRTADGSWEGGATAFRFKNPVITTVKFKAYYPYTANSDITGSDPKEGTIAVDASKQTADDQMKFDFLYADKADEAGTSDPEGDRDNPLVKFQFKHSMTKLIIVLKADKSVSTLEGIVPTLKGLATEGTFKLSDGTVEAKPEVNNLVLENKLSTSTATEQTFIAIVPPQTTLADDNAPYLILQLGADTYLSTKVIASQTLQPGKVCTLTITVKKAELVVNSSDITNWEADGTTNNGDAVLQ